jgi:hypothetical protein
VRKKGFAAALCAVALAGLVAGPAFGGEVTGNGTPLWTDNDDWNDEHHTLHGKSECAFSGQEDGQFPQSPEYDPNAFHAQSWGQIARTLEGGHRGVPGFACNPARAGGGG